MDRLVAVSLALVVIVALLWIVARVWLWTAVLDLREELQYMQQKQRRRSDASPPPRAAEPELPDESAEAGSVGQQRDSEQPKRRRRTS
jgi:hypothetical protein